MKSLSKVMLATVALIAFAGAQADSVDVTSCTANASTATGTNAKNADAWVAGTYTETGADALTVNGNDCWATNANQAISDAQGQALLQDLTGATLSLVFDSTKSTSGWYTTPPGGEDSNGAETFTIAQNIYDCSAAASCFLVIKDGNVIPAQYIFDISGWDRSSLTFTNIFANYVCGTLGSGEDKICNGAISGVQFWHVGNSVPEPMTLLLLGAGLLGLGLRRQLQA